jgi:Concanavalin A-like lectin/glucanases superfamily/FG-GAP-like repeat/Putative Ig domain/Bacterial Ig domain
MNNKLKASVILTAVFSLVCFVGLFAFKATAHKRDSQTNSILLATTLHDLPVANLNKTAPAPVMSAPVFANLVVTNLNNGGAGSLRQATVDAASGDTITFQAGLTGAITLATQLLINKNLTINGPGAGIISLSGNNAVRVFETGANATISGLTITQGKNSLDGGGGIFNTGTLTLNNCAISNNYTDIRGGGIYSTGAITINNCTISNNSSRGNPLNGTGLGGGVYLSSSATIQASLFSGNAADGGGGAIVIGATATPISLQRCQILNNTASGGGGIAILNSQTGSVKTITLEQTTIAGNIAGTGGGISAGGGDVTLKNCTISGNTATASGTSGGGGGVNRGIGTMAFINSTVVNNRVVVPTGTSGYGGGIASYPVSTNTGLSLKNTIVADNSASFGADMYLFYGFTSLGNNLIGNNSNHFGEIVSDLVNVSPQLFPLGDYGGPVPTHLTKPGSPAINAGQDTTAAPDNLTIDARSIPRKLGTAVDIGAVENAQTLTFTPTSLAAGTTGIAYNQAITAAGGSNFKVAAGKLPLGLTLSTSGVLSGTPIEAGTFDLTIAAADANGYRGAISYSLIINPVAPVAGRLNALAMPGASANQQYVTFTEAQSPQVTGYPALTIETWIKPTSATGRYDILNRFPIFFNLQDGKPAFYLYGLTNPGYYLADTTLPTGVWSHLAVTWDGKNVQFYINGVTSGSTAVTGAVDNTVKLPLSLGYCIECGGGGGFLGEFDEIRLWKVARTQTQIQSNQYLGLTGFESGLEAYWRFDETSGTTVADATGRGYNGTINNLVTRVNSDKIVTNEDTPYNGKLFGYDKYFGAPLTYAVVTQGSKGTVSVNATTGTFTYTPNLNANGIDSFTYKVNNGLDSAPATMSVTINPVADPPVFGSNQQLNLAQGSVATNVTIASVTDVDNNAPGAFNVSVSALFSGITITNIVNTNGVITATVAADCTARIGSDPSQLTASNGPLTATGYFTVNVVAGNPTITTQPVSISRCAGTAATFSVTATGDNLSYQWRKNGVIIAGATSNAYTIPSIANTDAGSYDVVVSRACGQSLTSAAATLSINGTNPGTLGNYGATSVLIGSSTTITPDAAPTGASSGTVYTATAAGNFTGALTINPATGVVSVTSPQSVGTYTMSVIATTLCGNTTTKTFSLTVSRPPACADTNFSGTTNISVGTNPYGVTVSDFNGDGKLDFATANSTGSGTVSIRLGDGLGGFSGTTNVSVGNQPQSVVVGDFNGDGKLDFATPTYGTSSVAIRLGDGAGNFSGTTSISVGAGPVSAAPGDFNGDGKLDFATANYGGSSGNSVSIRLGDGTGNFSGTTTISVGTAPHAVAVGDFNGDGKLDFATANEIGRTVSIRLGDGAGNFSGTTEVSVSYSPESIAFGDFNGDGKLDFATANYGLNAVSIRLGDGTGNFSGTTTVSVGTRPYSVAVGDFNSDGKLDFATASSDSNSVSIRLGDGAGNFSGTTNISVGTRPISVAPGDFNSDGRLDFATADSGSSTVSIRLNSCNTAPTITASNGLTRTQGTNANLTIAQVSDLETTAGSLIVTASAVPTGITLSNITNTNGSITANVAVDCTAVVGANNVSLMVTDGGGATATGNLIVNVTASPAPAPTITTQPVAQSIVSGNPVTFTVAGTNATSVQWQVSTNGGQFWTNLPGATTTTLSFPVRRLHNGNRYRAVLSNCTGAVSSNSVLLTVTDSAPAVSLTGLVIREFRLRGNAASTDPAQDEYLELQNVTANVITVNNGGWAVAALAADGNSYTTIATIPNGTIIPAKGHYLLVNTNGYSLSALATGDATFTTNLADDSGLALFNTPTAANFSTATRLDAVGFQSAGTQASLFREGTGLVTLGVNNGEYAWVRKMQNGQIIDTDNNANDFALVSTLGNSINAVSAQLGAPAPTNATGATEMNSQIFQTLFDPLVVSSATPNQVRDINPLTNGTFGSLVLRRTFTNYTGVPLKKLRFRVIDITNAATGAEAELRVLNSVTATINGQVVEGLTLGQPPIQTQGGGLNSTLAVGSITPAQPLAAGGTVNVEFKLGVMRKGQYRFFLNIEAAP